MKCRFNLASWGNWGNWEGCSAYCGIGNSIRRRLCSLGATIGNVGCEGNSEESRSCQFDNCRKLFLKMSPFGIGN